MALRLIEMVVQEKDGEEVRELLKEHKVLDHRHLRLPDGEVLVRILLDAEQSEAVLDLLGERYAGKEGNRVVILGVEAILPRDEPEPVDSAEPTAPEEKSPERIGREELYEDVKDAARCSWVYPAMAMGALSLFLMNLICVNLAGVTTFLVQSIRPTTWWEKDRASKAMRITIGLWVTLLAALSGMILWLGKT